MSWSYLGKGCPNDVGNSPNPEVVMIATLFNSYRSWSFLIVVIAMKISFGFSHVSLWLYMHIVERYTTQLASCSSLQEIKMCRIVFVFFYTFAFMCNFDITLRCIIVRQGIGASCTPKIEFFMGSKLLTYKFIVILVSFYSCFFFQALDMMLHLIWSFHSCTLTRCGI